MHARVNLFFSKFVADGIYPQTLACVCLLIAASNLLAEYVIICYHLLTLSAITTLTVRLRTNALENNKQGRDTLLFGLFSWWALCSITRSLRIETADAFSTVVNAANALLVLCADYLFYRESNLFRNRNQTSKEPAWRINTAFALVLFAINMTFVGYSENVYKSPFVFIFVRLLLFCAQCFAVEFVADEDNTTVCEHEGGNVAKNNFYVHNTIMCLWVLHTSPVFLLFQIPQMLLLALHHLGLNTQATASTPAVHDEEDS